MVVDRLLSIDGRKKSRLSVVERRVRQYLNKRDVSVGDLSPAEYQAFLDQIAGSQLTIRPLITVIRRLGQRLGILQ